LTHFLQLQNRRGWGNARHRMHSCLFGYSLPIHCDPHMIQRHISTWKASSNWTCPTYSAVGQCKFWPKKSETCLTEQASIFSAIRTYKVNIVAVLNHITTQIWKFPIRQDQTLARTNLIL
jgi:hypothetical protein